MCGRIISELFLPQFAFLAEWLRYSCINRIVGSNPTECKSGIISARIAQSVEQFAV